MDFTPIVEKFGIAVAAAAIACYLAWFLLRAYIADLTDRVRRTEAKADANELYIREELSVHLTEAHDRERRLASIVARCRGCPDLAPDPDPTPESEIKTEPISRESLTPSRARRATIRDGEHPPR